MRDSGPAIYETAAPRLWRPKAPGILLNWYPGSQERLDFTKLFALCHKVVAAPHYPFRFENRGKRGGAEGAKSPAIQGPIAALRVQPRASGRVAYAVWEIELLGASTLAAIRARYPKASLGAGARPMVRLNEVTYERRAGAVW